MNDDATGPADPIELAIDSIREAAHDAVKSEAKARGIRPDGAAGVLIDAAALLAGQFFGDLHRLADAAQRSAAADELSAGVVSATMIGARPDPATVTPLGVTLAPVYQVSRRSDLFPRYLVGLAELQAPRHVLAGKTTVEPAPEIYFPGQRVAVLRDRDNRKGLTILPVRAFLDEYDFDAGDRERQEFITSAGL